MRPRVFVGSARKSLHLAHAVQANLQYDTETTLWPQDVFAPGENTLRSLLDALSRSDFGVFILSPDDLIQLGKQKLTVPRDNVVLELGMFLGRLGPDRAFFLQPRNQNQHHIPTDLLGITPAEYDAERSDANWNSAVGPACAQILSKIKQAHLNQSQSGSPQVHGFSRPPERRRYFNDYRGDRVVQSLWADPVAQRHGGRSPAFIYASVEDEAKPYLRIRFSRQGFGANLTLRPMNECPVDATEAKSIRFRLRGVGTEQMGVRIRVVDAQNVCWGFGRENLVYSSTGLVAPLRRWSKQIVVPFDPKWWFHFPYDGATIASPTPDFSVIKLITFEPGFEPRSGERVEGLTQFALDRPGEGELHVSVVTLE